MTRRVLVALLALLGAAAGQDAVSRWCRACGWQAGTTVRSCAPASVILVQVFGRLVGALQLGGAASGGAGKPRDIAPLTRGCPLSRSSHSPAEALACCSCGWDAAARCHPRWCLMTHCDSRVQGRDSRLCIADFCLLLGAGTCGEHRGSSVRSRLLRWLHGGQAAAHPPRRLLPWHVPRGVHTVYAPPIM